MSPITVNVFSGGCDGPGVTLTELKELLVTNQEKLNAVAAAIDAGVAGIRADIDALKAQVAAGESLDFTALDAKVASLQALDAEHPPAPPVA